MTEARTGAVIGGGWYMWAFNSVIFLGHFTQKGFGSTQLYVVKGGSTAPNEGAAKGAVKGARPQDRLEINNNKRSSPLTSLGINSTTLTASPRLPRKSSHYGV